MTELDREEHWQGVYGAKKPTEVSWFQTRPDMSLSLIARTGVGKDAALVDVGSGASTLIDHLLDERREDITVLDISEQALDHAQDRLRERAGQVNWVVADITKWDPPRRYDLWHDRAVLHFLTRPEDQAAYGTVIRNAVKLGGWAMIAGFAPGGPTKCSGLDIVQHDAASLSRIISEDFSLVDTREEEHATPWGATQAFRYHLFRKAA